MIDKNEFFRNVTTCICGSLDIEKALLKCLLYLKNLIPVETMSLNTYEPDTDTIKPVTAVSELPIDSWYNLSMATHIKKVLTRTNEKLHAREGLHNFLKSTPALFETR